MSSQTVMPPDPVDPLNTQLSNEQPSLPTQPPLPAAPIPAAPIPAAPIPVAEPVPTALLESFTIYLARHATPDRTRPEISYHKLPGPGLNDRGLQEAAQLADFLHDMGVVSTLSSPFERTRQTALIAIQESGASLELDPDLGERQPFEPEAAVIERMLRAFTAGAQRAAQRGPLAIFTHGSPVLTLLKALGLPGSTLERCRIYDNRNPISMAGAWRIERLDGSMAIRPVFTPLGTPLPSFPEAMIQKENP